MTINEMAEKAHAMALKKGWYDGGERSFPELIALCHSELSEALEEYRNGHSPAEEYAREDGKPEGIHSELADVLIRVGDMAAYFGIDLESAVRGKMAFNATRPARHGGKIA